MKEFDLSVYNRTSLAWRSSPASQGLSISYPALLCTSFLSPRTICVLMAARRRTQAPLCVQIPPMRFGLSYSKDRKVGDVRLRSDLCRRRNLDFLLAVILCLSASMSTHFPLLTLGPSVLPAITTYDSSVLHLPHALCHLRSLHMLYFLKVMNDLTGSHHWFA